MVRELFVAPAFNHEHPGFLELAQVTTQRVMRIAAERALQSISRIERYPALHVEGVSPPWRVLIRRKQHKWGVRPGSAQHLLDSLSHKLVRKLFTKKIRHNSAPADER